MCIPTVKGNKVDNCFVVNLICLLGQSKGATSVLVKYISMVQEYSIQVLPIAIRAGSMGPKYYNEVYDVLTAGIFGALLPELVIGLVLLQLEAPLILSESDCIPLLNGLLELLDKFNRLSGNCLKCDESNMAFSGVKSRFESTVMFMTGFRCIIH